MPVSRKMLTKLFSATIEYNIPNKNYPSTFINNVENCGNEDTFISVFNKNLKTVPIPPPTKTSKTLLYIFLSQVFIPNYCN